MINNLHLTSLYVWGKEERIKKININWRVDTFQGKKDEFLSPKMEPSWIC